MPDIVRLSHQEWHTLRHMRLLALQDSPDRFLAIYEQEERFSSERWQAEFVRGDWHVCTKNSALVGLIGVTREAGRSPFERYIEYLWVDRSYRRQGIASVMLATVLGQLRNDGVRTALLWILTGNDDAMRLYEKVGFARTGVSQPIKSRPGLSEELMRLTLA